MAANNDIFSNEWCDLVFDTKNQLYGAYELRKNSSKRHLRAFVIASIAFVLVVLAPALIDQLLPKHVDRDVTVRELSNIEVDKPKENILKELPPPPPPLRNTIKFTPPVVKPDQQVQEEEQPKLQKEVVENKAAISNVNFDKGTDDVAAPVATEKQIVEEPDQPFVIVEQMPQFPGGEKEMMKFIKNNLRYPSLAAENGIQGTVIVNFVVDRDGRITKVKVVRGIGGGCDEEAVRVLGKMPLWNPGKQGGKAVLVSFTVPFKFILQ